MDLEKLQYPIGRFNIEQEIEDKYLSRLMKDIAILPSLLSDQLAKMSPAQINTAYRPGGWTAKQVVHHLADSHMNAHIRFILALTENQPTIKPYQEQLVAELPFIQQMPIEVSFEVIKSVHYRWFFLLQSLNLSDFDKTYLHPQYNKVYSLRLALASYAWHGKHHLAHLQQIV